MIKDLTCRVFLKVLLVVVVAIVVAVVVAVAVPAMVVRDLAPIAIPVAFIEAFSIMTRLNPARASVRWTGPVSVVPLIVVADRIPVARYPGIAGAGTSWLNPEHTYLWRRADSHSDGELREDGPRSRQHQHNQFSFHDFTSFSLDYNGGATETVSTLFAKA